MSRQVQPAQTMHNHPQTMAPMPSGPVDQMVHTPSTYPQYVYTTPLHPPRAMHPTAPAPPQTWQGPNSIAPQQTHMAPPHMIPRPPHPYRPDSWDGNYDQAPPPPPLVGAPGYDFRYRNEESDWSHGGPSDYYDPAVCPWIPWILSLNCVTHFFLSNLTIMTSSNICLKLSRRMANHLLKQTLSPWTNLAAASVNALR